ncbi:peptidase C13 family protein [Nitzschia inconspicua]|uniref:Peptidase C13 family protein n=1 Tax=Nitzschia inconspicua TaxID=303405 RepID=A0A9K3PUQ2_9STRA|nr:peptidase C13 family protein [Nitzschia inconspicua]
MAAFGPFPSRHYFKALSLWIFVSCVWRDHHRSRIDFSSLVAAEETTTRSNNNNKNGNNVNTNNDNIHAMIVSSSRYWFNYRHAMNALGMYQILRNNGIPDDNIVLMIADEYASNARNPYKNRMHATGIYRESWYNHTVPLDYRGSDVTVQNFIDALLGRAPKSLHTNADSDVLIYVTGHGGDQFFKFQDEEELTAQDIANLVDRMHQHGKYGKLLFIADTCQAFTLFDKVTAPNVLALGTSLKGENAYAHHSDKDLGLAVIERWTHAFLTSYERSSDTTTLHDIMVAPFAKKEVLAANVGIKDDTSVPKFKTVSLHEFFGIRGGGRIQDIPSTEDVIVTANIVVSQQQQQQESFGVQVERKRILMDLPIPPSPSFVVVMDKSTLGREDDMRYSSQPFEYPLRNLLVGFLAMVALVTTAEKIFLH